MQQETTNQLSMEYIHLPEYQSNPYPLYHRIRSASPVLWDEGLKTEDMKHWVVTGYDEVATVLRDSRFSAAGGWNTDWLPAEMLETLAPPLRAIARQMLFLDPPDHTRLRGLVSKAFTPRMIEKMRTDIQQIVDDLLDPIIPNKHIELVHDFAYPVPSTVIAEMLGVPPTDRPQFIKWSESFSLLLDDSGLTQEGLFQCLRDIVSFMDYFRQIIAERRKQPEDDVLQGLINAQEGDDRLSEEEVLGNCILLLAAGHITTTHLIGNAMLALMHNREQYTLLKENPLLISSAVLEFLRYDSPVQRTGRLVTAPIELAGQQLLPGQFVAVVLGAANRDPSHFSDPDCLDIRRGENRNLAFGQGVHYCLGAPLAKLEAEIAFTTLLKRLDAPEVDFDKVKRLTGVVFRGVKALPMTFH